MGRPERAKFNLDELRRRKFKLVLCLGRSVVTIAFAEPPDGVDREFLLTLQANAGTGGKSEDVFGLNLLPGAGILRSHAIGAAKQNTTCQQSK